MEAARTLTHLSQRMRRRRFTAALEELRPLGVAYVLRRFGGSLDAADAEDVVAEVIIRFHRLEDAGRPPGRLRPAFFQSVRNAGLDLLRYRGVRPTAPLEAAAGETAEVGGPEERAEAREDLVRLREAMARMRPNYREAIVLRFGLGMTVPEIAERVGISLPAAKKLVLRSTAQIRERMEAIEGREFCPRMRELAERSVIDGELAGVSGEAESAAVRAHLEHCGACRGFLAALRQNLHELGGGVLLAGFGAGRFGAPAPTASPIHTLLDGAHAGVDRVRLASYRVGAALRPQGADSVGLLAGTGQKIAAVCTAGAAGACIAAGVVGPGLGLAHHPPAHRHASSPSAHVRKAPDPTHRPIVTYGAPEVEAGGTEGEAPQMPSGPRSRGESAGKGSGTASKPRPKRTTNADHTEPELESASQTAQSQFGIEEESAPVPVEPAPTETSAPVAEARTVEPSTSASTSSSSSAGTESARSTGSGAGGGREEFGFGG